MTVPPAVRMWIERETGAPVRAVCRLPRATTSAVHRVDLDDGRRLVCRRYVLPRFLEEEPQAPQREVDVLSFAHRRGLAGPGVVAADPAGAGVGDGVPGLLMGFLPGRPVPAPDPDRLAEVVAAIHAVDPAGLGHDYFPWYVGMPAGPPAAARDPSVWERAIDLRSRAMPRYRPVLAHRDFHPGNVLWVRGRCTGVVDWANACRGPAGCDIAHCRTNLVRLAGPDAAERFATTYAAITGTAHDPYWDLASLLEHDLDHWTPETVMATERRLERVLAEL